MLQCSVSCSLLAEAASQALLPSGVHTPSLPAPSIALGFFWSVCAPVTKLRKDVGGQEGGLERPLPPHSVPLLNFGAGEGESAGVSPHGAALYVLPNQFPIYLNLVLSCVFVSVSLSPALLRPL